MFRLCIIHSQLGYHIQRHWMSICPSCVMWSLITWSRFYPVSSLCIYYFPFLLMSNLWGDTLRPYKYPALHQHFTPRFTIHPLRVCRYSHGVRIQSYLGPGGPFPRALPMFCAGPSLLNNHIFTIVFLFLLPPGTEAHSSFTQLTYENVLAKASELCKTQWGTKRRLCPLRVFNEPTIDLGRRDLDSLKGDTWKPPAH